MSLLRRTALPRSGRLPAMSSKRMGERDARRAAVAEVARRDGLRCAAVGLLEHRCTEQGGHGLDAHEVIPRSTWPGGHLVASNIRLVCRTAHEWIGANPAKAHDLGLHGWSYERPVR